MWGTPGSSFSGTCGIIARGEPTVAQDAKEKPAKAHKTLKEPEPA
jgi:hypothetical protein